MSLQRLVLTFKPEGVEIRALYRTKQGPNPGTKARRRTVEDLARTGLRDALEALEGGAECVGTSGYTTREDVLYSARVAPADDHKKLARRGHDRRVDRSPERASESTPGNAGGAQERCTAGGVGSCVLRLARLLDLVTDRSVGLERRDGNLYYYRSVRDGERVRKVYVGAGEIARIASEGDILRRTGQEAKRQEGKAELERLEALSAIVMELHEAAAVLARAHLVAAGCHRHKGEWRRARNA
jgi:hypothetical protein